MTVRLGGFPCLLAVAAIALGVVLSGCVWGIVKDVETGQPIVGAQVTFQDSHSDTGSTTTGAGGLYSFDMTQGQSVPAFEGTVTYQVAASGYDTLTLYDERWPNGPARDNPYIVNFELIPPGSDPLPDCHGATFRWAYQPDGSTNLNHGVKTGRTCLNGVGASGVRANQGLIFATGEVVNPVADVYFACAGISQPLAPNAHGPAFWANNGDGGVHDMGAMAFDGLTTAPDKSAGVGDQEFYNDQGVLTIPGHVYVVVTKDGQHYAKIAMEALSCG